MGSATVSVCALAIFGLSVYGYCTPLTLDDGVEVRWRGHLWCAGLAAFVALASMPAAWLASSPPADACGYACKVERADAHRQGFALPPH